MLSPDTLLLHFRIVGIIMALLVIVNVAVPAHLNWRGEMARLSLVNRQIFEVHAIFLVLMLAMFSALFLLLGPALLTPSPLRRAVVGGLTVFWGLRMVMQWCYYSPAIWRGDRVRTILHYGFSVVWVYVTAVCAAAL
jgi:hypothetical protein